jgi:hypothetical protein
LVEDISIRHVILNLLAQAVANSIAAFALVVVPFAFMGRWPPPELFIGSSISAALSPFVWRMYRAIYGGPVSPSEEGDVERPQWSDTSGNVPEEGAHAELVPPEPSE